MQYEKIESKLEPGQHAKLKSAIDALIKRRHEAAHTYLGGRGKTVDAPSVIIAYFDDIYKGLSDIDEQIKKRT